MILRAAFIAALVVIAALIVVIMQGRLEADHRVYDIQQHQGPDCTQMVLLPARVEKKRVRFEFQCSNHIPYQVYVPIATDAPRKR